MASFKRSLARDFRIDVQAVDTVLHEEGEGGEEEEEEEEDIDEREESESDAEDSPPSAKRLRKS